MEESNSKYKLHQKVKVVDGDGTFIGTVVAIASDKFNSLDMPHPQKFMYGVALDTREISECKFDTFNEYLERFKASPLLKNLIVTTTSNTKYFTDEYRVQTYFEREVTLIEQDTFIELIEELRNEL